MIIREIQNITACVAQNPITKEYEIHDAEKYPNIVCNTSFSTFGKAIQFVTGNTYKFAAYITKNGKNVATRRIIKIDNDKISVGRF